MSDTTANNYDQTEFEDGQNVTQGENPGAQGDFGAGQGTPGNDPVVTDPEPIIEGDEQPRREEQFDDNDDDARGSQF